LTLLVVPVVYMIFDDMTSAFHKKRQEQQLLPGDVTALEIEGEE
jgi:hypothetical protein